MVFSQTSHKTQSILKVVEIDRLKPEKNQQVNGSTGVITGGNIKTAPPSPAATTSFSEVYLKPEPVFESNMFHDSDCEFFQDLVPWCSEPAKEELVQTTDSLKKIQDSDNAHNIDTLHTAFSPQGWDVFDANSPTATGFYISTPNDPMSPGVDGLHLENKFLYSNDIENEKKIQPEESNWDINNLPVVVLGDLAAEKMVDLNPCYIAEPVVPHNTYDTEYTKPTNTHKMLFFDQEDYLDSVIPREIENNDVVISEIIMNEDRRKEQVLQKTRVERHVPGLSLDVTASAPWSADIISTPDVVSYVAELEKEECTLPGTKTPEPWLLPDTGNFLTDTYSKLTTTPSIDYEPITPKSESHFESDVDDLKSRISKRRRHDSEDSDETYTPEIEYSSTRKYKKRKPSISIKDKISALEESQQMTKARRGRPPKRRESTVSSVCSIDDHISSVSTQETKYRELRDKNNEASKRSRMNRKLKELQMEQQAVELEERNKKLKVKADILEDMTKRLKDALMTAILQK